MNKKPRFNPEITRVKLNPEQAVLACTCYNNRKFVSDGATGTKEGCVQNTRDYLTGIRSLAPNASIS